MSYQRLTVRPRPLAVVTFELLVQLLLRTLFEVRLPEGHLWVVSLHMLPQSIAAQSLDITVSTFILRLLIQLLLLTLLVVRLPEGHLGMVSLNMLPQSIVAQFLDVTEGTIILGLHHQHRGRVVFPSNVCLHRVLKFPSVATNVADETIGGQINIVLLASRLEIIRDTAGV